MSNPKHSKTPWFITQSRSGLYIAKEGGGIVACAVDGYCTDPQEARDDAAFIVEAVNSYADHQTLIAKMTEALEECGEYFDNRSDADFNSDDGFIPNKEMRLLSVVNEALAKSEGL